MTQNRLTALYVEQRQSPWLDNLRRGYLTSGQLIEIRDRGIRGLTSNPTIFQKAIQGSPDYDEPSDAAARLRSPVLRRSARHPHPPPTKRPPPRRSPKPPGRSRRAPCVR